MTDLDPPATARVIPLGEPIEGGEALFEGSLPDARAFVAQLTVAERADVSVWTPGHIFGADELLAEQPGHEHDRQP